MNSRRGFRSDRALRGIVLAGSLACKASDSSGDGPWDAQFGLPGMNHEVLALNLGLGRLYAGGMFTNAGGVPASAIAVWDGMAWSASGDGLRGGVYAVAAASDGVYAGGQFEAGGTVSATNIAVWKGTEWSALGAGVDRLVLALALADGSLFAGGQFLSAGGQQANKIARWDGTNWWPLGEGLSMPEGAEFAAVFSLLVRGNALYVGGRFTSASGVAATNIARWDGTNWWPVGEGLNAQVHDLAMVGEDLYACGQFRRIGSMQVTNIARWDGMNWHSLGATFYRRFGSVGVTELAVSGSDLYVGGAFDEVSGVPARSVARWDGQQWWALGSGVIDLSSLAATGSELYMGGIWDEAGGKESHNIALWHIPHLLEVRQSGGQVRLSWPATGSNYVVEATASLHEPVWQRLDQTPVLEGNRLTVSEPLSSAQRFYRLRKPWPPGSGQ